jgi:nitrogen fixation protein FixH
MRLFIILLAVLSILVLASTIATIVVGTRTFEGIVVDKPYETGLAWDETAKQKSLLGWKVVFPATQFTEGRNDLFFTVLDRNGAPLSEAAAVVSISRPSTGAFDKTYQTRREQDGRYHAVIDLPLHGNWEVTIMVNSREAKSGFKNTIFAERGAK